MTQTLERTTTHDDTVTEPVFTTTRATLADALATVGVAIVGRPSVPVLAGVLLRAHGSDLMVCGFDYDTAITVRIPDAVTTPGTLLVRHRELSKLVSALTKGMTKKRADASTVTLAGRDPAFATLTLADHTMPLERLPLEDYPQLPASPQVFARMEGDRFLSQVRRVMPAVGRDDVLPMLTGVKVDPSDTGLIIAGSDRYRLAVGHVEATLTNDAPAVLLNGFMLRKILPKLTGTGTLTLGHGIDQWGIDLIELETGPVSILTRQHNDGESFVKGTEYPKYFPTEVATTVTIDRQVLISHTEKATEVMKATDRDSLPIVLTVGQDTVRMAPRLGEGDHYVSTPDIPATVDGQTHDVIGLNPRYTLDALATFTGSTVTLHIQSPTKPVVLTDAGEKFDDPTTYRHLLMPLRLT